MITTLTLAAIQNVFRNATNADFTTKETPELAQLFARGRFVVVMTQFGSETVMQYRDFDAACESEMYHRDANDTAEIRLLDLNTAMMTVDGFEIETAY